LVKNIATGVIAAVIGWAIIRQLSKVSENETGIASDVLSSASSAENQSEIWV